MAIESRNVFTKSSHTRCVVSFHSDQVNGEVTLGPYESRLGKLIGVSTNKTLGEASGTFTITIKKPTTAQGDSARSWLRYWQDPEGIWCRIKFIVDGQTIDTMLGIVDSVNESTQRTGVGARSETYTVSGRDFGKVFEQSEIFTNMFSPTSRHLTQGVELRGLYMDEFIATPARFLRFLVQAYLSNNSLVEAPWVLPASLGGSPFADILNTDSVQAMDRTVNGEMADPSFLSPDTMTGQRLWDVMHEHANDLMNELFCDLGPLPNQAPANLETLTPKLYLRERPFPTRSDDNRTTNRTNWNNLRTRTLNPGDVQARQLAKGGAATRFNYWMLSATSNAIALSALLQEQEGADPGQPGNIPIYNNESIARHGVRRWEQSTRWLPIFESNDENEIWIRLGARWMKKLHDWYVIAPMQITGTLRTTRVFPEIRVGERVLERRAEGNIYFYCEGVAHEWQYPGASATTLTLTRGEYEGEDLLDAVYRQYENPASVSNAEACIPDLDVAPDLATDENFIELIGGLSRRRPFCAPPMNQDFTATQVNPDGTSFELPESEQLISEQDGSVPEAANSPAVGDAGMVNPIVSQDPRIESGVLPPPAALDANPTAVTQETLERGQPLPETGDLEFGDDNDPIGGLGGGL